MLIGLMSFSFAKAHSNTWKKDFGCKKGWIVKGRKRNNHRTKPMTLTRWDLKYRTIWDIKKLCAMGKGRQSILVLDVLWWVQSWPLFLFRYIDLWIVEYKVEWKFGISNKEIVIYSFIILFFKNVKQKYQCIFSMYDL